MENNKLLNRFAIPTIPLDLLKGFAESVTTDRASCDALIKTIKDDSEKVIFDNDVDQSLINHPQFFGDFCAFYALLSHNGKYPVMVNVNYDGSVSIFNEVRDVALNDDVFSSASYITKHTLSLKRRGNMEYFCDEERNVATYFPKYSSGKKVVSATKSFDVYSDMKLVANSRNTISRGIPLDYNAASAITLVPDVDLDYALDGLLPVINESLLTGSNYILETARLTDGIVKGASKRKCEGKYQTIWEEKDSESFLESGCDSLRNGTGTEYYSRTLKHSSLSLNDTTETYLDSRFKSVKEAREYFGSAYDSGRKTK